MRRAKMKRVVWIVLVGSLFYLTSLGGALENNPRSPRKTPELLKQGKNIYEQTCSACHGTKGDGKGPAGAVLKPPPTDFTKPLRQWPYTKGDLIKVFEVITKGIPNSSMVAWNQYSEQERWALTYAVTEFAAPAKKGK